MTKPKPLTAKQEAFAVEYVDNGGNASAAYRHAYETTGSAEKTVWENASRTLADSKVAARVLELQEARKVAIQWTDIERLKALKDIVKATHIEKPQVAVSAIAEANKMLGSYAPERRELSGGLTVLGPDQIEFVGREDEEF